MDKWIAMAERHPPENATVIISDGKEVGMATFGYIGGHRKPWWGGCGFSGYEWEWDFTPTHWMPFNVELPQGESKDGL